MKKFFALILALSLMMSLALPAMAAEDTYTLTINNTAPGHTYDAYQIFKGTLSDDGKTLADVDWGVAIYNDVDGDGVIEAEDGDYDYSAALIAALKADTAEIPQTGNTTTTLAAKLVGITAASGKAAAEQLADFLADSVDPVDSVVLDRIAEVIGEFANGTHTYMGNYSGTSVEVIGADGKTTGYTIADLPEGYYLIKDRDGSVTAEGDFYTKYLIKLTTTQAINVKGEGVVVEKSVNDTIGGTYGDYEDFDIADTAYYMWQGSLPSNLLSYDEYNYTFVDELPYGMEFIRIEAVYIQDDDGNRVHTFMDLHDEATDNDTLPADIVLTVEDVNEGTGEDEVQHTVTLDFVDLLSSWELIQPDHEVVVKYSALVTRNAVIAEAMTNEVILIYDNNPSGEGEGRTIPDYAHAFTFDLVIDKYDAENESHKLEGAEFLLYFTRIENEQTVHYYALVVTEELIALNKDEDPDNDIEINGHPLIDEYLGQVYGWTTNRDEASVLDTDANGYLKVAGLDAGTYYLEEIKAPDGYNKLNSIITVEIIPTYANTNTEDATVTVEYKVDGHGVAGNEVNIANSKGTVLPTTGGMGTTLFYVFGVAMVVAAAVLLITKKRMAAQN